MVKYPVTDEKCRVDSWQYQKMSIGRDMTAWIVREGADRTEDEQRDTETNEYSRLVKYRIYTKDIHQMATE